VNSALAAADSLKLVADLRNLYDFQRNSHQYVEAIFTSTRSLEINRTLGDSIGMISDLNQLAAVYFETGESGKALTSAFEAVELLEGFTVRPEFMETYRILGDIFSNIHEYKLAEEYYSLSLETAEKVGDELVRSHLQLLIGETSLKMQEFTTASLHAVRAIDMFKSIGDTTGEISAYELFGEVQYDLGHFSLARENLTIAINLANAINDSVLIASANSTLGKLLMRRREYEEAILLCETSLKVASDVELLMEIYDCLYQSYKGAKDTQKALQYFELYNELGDSLQQYGMQREILRLDAARIMMKDSLDTQIAFQQKINEERSQRNMILYAGFFIVLVTLMLWSRLRYISRSKERLRIEKERSEDLLLNILPGETAKELLANGKVEAKKYEEVTVLFSDFRNFTQVSQDADPGVLVSSIDYYYKVFDEIADRFGLEKIKTIGDAYMCAGGLPAKNSEHPRHVVEAALMMSRFVKAELKEDDQYIHFEVRIGIHTGPVVAGVVGTKKWQYDIWGDTVNIAARMQAKSEVGKINISETTYNLIKDDFECTSRGEIEMKNRGPIRMYFIDE